MELRQLLPSRMSSPSCGNKPVIDGCHIGAPFRNSFTRVSVKSPPTLSRVFVMMLILRLDVVYQQEPEGGLPSLVTR